MIAIGDFTFKSFKEREAGKFITSNGEVVEYKASHILKFDDINEDGNVYERKAKVELDNFQLIAKLSALKMYQPVTLKFNVSLLQEGKTGLLKLIDVIEQDVQENVEQVENQ